MAGHIAEDSLAKVPPVPPGFWHVGRVIGPRRRGTKPEVPMNVRRDRWHGSWPVAVGQALDAPDMAFVNFSNRPGFHQLNRSAVISSGMNLRAHLGREVLVLSGELSNRSRFIHRMR